MQIGINTNVNTNTEIDNASSNKAVVALESLLETPEVTGVASENPIFQANNNVLESSLSANYLAATLNNLLNNQSANTSSGTSSNAGETSSISNNPLYQGSELEGSNPLFEANVVAGGATEPTVQNNPLYNGAGNSGDNPLFEANAIAGGGSSAVVSSVSDGDVVTVQSNPIYKPSGTSGNNPLNTGE